MSVWDQAWMIRERVYAFLRRILRSRSDADDALQTTYTTIWDKKDTDQAKKLDDVSAWTFTIAFRAAIEIIRKRRHQATQPSDRAIDQPDTQADPERRVEVKRLLLFMSRLSDEECEVVLLFHVSGMTHKEIAERLEISERASRTRLCRALEKLNKAYEDLTKAYKKKVGGDHGD